MKLFYFSTIINPKCASLNLFIPSKRALYNILGRYYNSLVPFSYEKRCKPKATHQGSRLKFPSCFCVKARLSHNELGVGALFFSFPTSLPWGGHGVSPVSHCSFFMHIPALFSSDCRPWSSTVSTHLLGLLWNRSKSSGDKGVPPRGYILQSPVYLSSSGSCPWQCSKSFVTSSSFFLLFYLNRCLNKGHITDPLHAGSQRFPWIIL